MEGADADRAGHDEHALRRLHAGNEIVHLYFIPRTGDLRGQADLHRRGEASRRLLPDALIDPAVAVVVHVRQLLSRSGMNSGAVVVAVARERGEPVVIAVVAIG